MVTRQTKAGVLGPEHAIDRYTAMKLYTANAARLVGEDDLLGALQPVKLADIVASHKDPLTCAIDELPELRPSFTLGGGEVEHDPEGLFKRS